MQCPFAIDFAAEGVDAQPLGARVGHLAQRLPRRHHAVTPERADAEHPFVTRGGDFDRFTVLHRRGHRAHPAVGKVDIADRLAAFVEDVSEGHRHGDEIGKEAAEGGGGERREEPVLRTRRSARRLTGGWRTDRSCAWRRHRHDSTIAGVDGVLASLGLGRFPRNAAAAGSGSGSRGRQPPEWYHRAGTKRVVPEVMTNPTTPAPGPASPGPANPVPSGPTPQPNPSPMPNPAPHPNPGSNPSA
jgi:hypothetical protein